MTTKLDNKMKKFLRKIVRTSQSIDVAFWAQKVLDSKVITTEQLARLIHFGFE